MDKKTQTWLELASNDMEFAGQIIKNGQRPYFACHQCHQAIEKLLKAAIQYKTGEIPPRTHNLPTLANLADLSLSENQTKFLFRLNPHYIGTRYPDDLAKFYKQYTQKYASVLFRETEGLFICIKNHIIQKN